MLIKSLIALMAILFGVFFSRAIADDLPVTKFATECSFETELNVHGIITTGKVYLKGNKAKRETTSQGKESIVIIDGDNKTIYYLLVSQKQSVPIPYKPEVMDRLVNPTIPKGTVTLVGPDTLNGVQYTKYTIAGAKIYTVWLDQLNYLAKMESQDGNYSFTILNLTGPPIQDSEFVVPGTYTEIQTPKVIGKDEATPTPPPDK